MPDIYDFAAMLLKNNQNIANSPLGQNALQALQNRDSAKGEEIANNILESQGLSREEALNDIQQKGSGLIPNFPFFR